MRRSSDRKFAVLELGVEISRKAMLGDFMGTAIEQVAVILEPTDHRKENWCACRPDVGVSLPNKLIVVLATARASQFGIAQCGAKGKRGILGR